MSSVLSSRASSSPRPRQVYHRRLTSNVPHARADNTILVNANTENAILPVLTRPAASVEEKSSQIVFAKGNEIRRLGNNVLVNVPQFDIRCRLFRDWTDEF